MKSKINNLISLVLLPTAVLFFYTGCSGGGNNTISYSVSGVTFNMIAAKGNTFPVEIDDSGEATVANDFLIGETEVTYELWLKVYTWAGANSYTFQNPGRQGGGSGSDPVGNNQHPVTTINWRDCMVWCNALTEYYNEVNSTTLSCVYKDGDTPIRDSSDTNDTVCDSVTADESADGFRLLTSDEWELAARYIGSRAPDTGNDIDTDAVTTEVSGKTWYWTPGDYASGAETNALDVTATGAVAWYVENSDLTTHEAASKACNALGLYDMTGNVNEWRFDLDSVALTERIARGGGYAANVSGGGQSGFLLIGSIPSYIPTHTIETLGFRLGMNK